jgi:hypothetical protein
MLIAIAIALGSARLGADAAATSTACKLGATGQLTTCSVKPGATLDVVQTGGNAVYKANLALVQGSQKIPLDETIAVSGQPNTVGYTVSRVFVVPSTLCASSNLKWELTLTPASSNGAAIGPSKSLGILTVDCPQSPAPLPGPIKQTH